MSDKQQEILKRAQACEKRYNQLTWLISAPEIIADNRYWRRLADEYAALEPIAAILSDANGTQHADFFNTLEHLLTTLSDNPVETAVIEVNAKHDNSFADELFTAYKTYAQKKGFTLLPAPEPVTSTRSLCITGAGAFDVLKAETGLHRAIYTVFANVEAEVSVYPYMPNYTAFVETDVKFDVFRSGGAGGQHVNKTESAVRATHLPSAVSVVCQDERSQHKNKQRALEQLKLRVKKHYDRQNANHINAAKKAAQKSVLVRVYDFARGSTESTVPQSLKAFVARGGRTLEFY
ncbi:MAG: PCRF domain-containing protein [Firmicutes bacterium]|nr:PCRF domain-containing protein [Bacillota bacterium]